MIFVEVLASNTIHPDANNAQVMPSTSLVLGDITNHITPLQVQQWTTGIPMTLASLQKGTGTCAVVVGEDKHGELLLNELQGLKEFKMKLGKRELISVVSCCFDLNYILSSNK
jgi:hypothetical protein